MENRGNGRGKEIGLREIRGNCKQMRVFVLLILVWKKQDK